MNIPLFSIIIPVYKVEQYLPECIDSIIKQTFTNFELLLIDDGSPDRSAEICDAYALKDNRIHVFHEKNGGVSFARNIGLDNAQGKWITFIDSDDWVEKDYLEKIYAEVVSFNADLIVWSIVHRYANYSSLKDIRKKGCFDEKNDILECLMFLDMNGLLESPCNKCYKRSIIESFKLRFDMNMSHLEDFDFNLRYFPLVNSLSTINRGLYNYRRDDLNSLSRKRPFDYIELCNKLLNKRKDLFSSCQSTVKEKYFYYLDKKKELLLMPSLNLYLDGTKPKVRIDLWRRYIRVMNPIIIKSKFDVTFHDRFRALLLYTHNPYIIDFGYNILYSVRKFLPKLYNKLRNLLSAK